MAFEQTPDVRVVARGPERLLIHPRRPYTGPGEEPIEDLEELIHAYYEDVLPLLQTAELRLERRTLPSSPDEGKELRPAAWKGVGGLTASSYTQFVDELELWSAGLTFIAAEQPSGSPGILGARGVLYPAAVLSTRSSAYESAPALSVKTLAQRLGLADDYEERELKIEKSGRTYAYRYSWTERHEPDDQNGPAPPPSSFLLPVPEWFDQEQDGRFLQAVEVRFSLDVTPWKAVPFLCFLERDSLLPLRVQSLIASMEGWVFEDDPRTRTGRDDLSPSSPAEELQRHAVARSLPRLNADGLQLEGRFVKVRDFSPPETSPPLSNRAGQFLYSICDDPEAFAAVNAYFHVDSLFRRVDGLGLLETIFGKSFSPVEVDHRGESFQVNAHAIPDSTGARIRQITFGLCEAGCRVGNASDRRLAAHEFGHAVMFHTIERKDFRFVHSIGDSLAAVLSDPCSLLCGSDRYQTFPFTRLRGDRNHGRSVGDGWAWGGQKDDRGYLSEQILSTSIFRVYESAGGAFTHVRPEVQKQVRERAAERVFSLLMRTMACLPPDETNSLYSVDQLAEALQLADSGEHRLLPQSLHKVVRWSFEQQGLYQPEGDDSGHVWTPGAPPDIDAFIDERRGSPRSPGGYAFKPDFWRDVDLWNQLSREFHGGHEAAVAGRSNYLFARVRNRGARRARQVTVRLWVSPAAIGSGESRDWTPVEEARLSELPGHASSLVGPIEWCPSFDGDVSILATVDCSGDRSNLMANDRSTPLLEGPLAEAAATDNNTALRSFSRLRGSSHAPIEAFGERALRIQNPLGVPDDVVLEAQVSRELREHGYDLRFPDLQDGICELESGQPTVVRVVLDRVERSPHRSGPRGTFDLAVVGRCGGAYLGGFTYELVLE